MERDRLLSRLTEQGGTAEAVDHVAPTDEQRRAGRDLSLVILQGVACPAGGSAPAELSLARARARRWRTSLASSGCAPRRRSPPRRCLPGRPGGRQVRPSEPALHQRERDALVQQLNVGLSLSRPRREIGACWDV